MNTTIKLSIICVICAAMTMSGCTGVDPEIGEIDVYTPTTTADSMPSPPMIVSLESHWTDIQIILNSNGEMEMATLADGSVEKGTWDLISKTDTSKTYELTYPAAESEGFRLTLYNDGRAVGEQMGIEFPGRWEPMNEDYTEKPDATPTKATPTKTPRSTPKTTPAPVANTDSEFIMEYPFLVSIAGTGVQEGVNFIIMIDDDGETCYHYTWCGMNIGAAQEIVMMDVSHNGNSITYRGNDPDGMAISITAYETERGGGRATQIGFSSDSDCVWNPWDNVPKTITNKIVDYNQEWL